MHRAVCLLILSVWSLPAPAQGTRNTLKVSPAIFRANDEATSFGARWEILGSAGGRFTHDTFPRRFQIDFGTEGAAAWDPDANPETIRAQLRTSG